MYEFNKIKLVIWDLDNTFWNGIISEGKISVPEININLVKRLTDIGIINSICSKNDYDVVNKQLDYFAVRELFVFLSINWEPKGLRIRDIISDMQLRPDNVLFIDDNVSNLEEAKYYCKNIMTAEPNIIEQLYNDALKCKKLDAEHKRLYQYKILEEKKIKKTEFSSNEEFLFDSKIKISIHTDCKNNIDRIHDLVLRSNQLNFTKIRSSKDELSEMFDNSDFECGYVRVSDKFGDYGVTGFYALNKNNETLLHFCFSCRTLGMGIEQYIYNYLNRPKLAIVGEVTSSLERQDLPPWINNFDNSGKQTDKNVDAIKSSAGAHSVLIKGPCDLFQILPYIADKSIIDTEMTHVINNGITIESTGHTTHIVEAMRLTDEQKNRIINELVFADESIYNSAIYKNDYKVVIISILSDANLGVYRRKETGERIAFLEGYHPLTDPNNYDKYISGEYICGGVKFTKEMLMEFSEKYEFEGINTPEKIVENLIYIRKHLPKDCEMAVMLGGELYYEKNTNPAYENRHIVHKKINDAIRAVADDYNIRLLDVNKYLVDQSSFYDHFNHYIKPVYYKLAGDILDIINEKTGADIHESSKIKILQVRAKESLAPFYYKLKKLFK